MSVKIAMCIYKHLVCAWYHIDILLSKGYISSRRLQKNKQRPVLILIPLYK